MSFSAPQNYTFVLSRDSIVYNRTMFISTSRCNKIVAAECESDCEAVVSASFKKTREVTPGYSFIDTLEQKGNPHKYKFALGDEAAAKDASSALIHVYQGRNKPFRADISVLDSEKKKTPLVSYDNIVYVLRVYPDQKRSLRQVVESLQLDVRVESPAQITITVTPKPSVVELEGLTMNSVADYVEKGKSNCYSTTKIEREGGSVMVQLESRDVVFYANHGSMPEKLEDFAYQYKEGEFTVIPADKFAAVSFLVPRWPEGEFSDNRTYFCISGTGRGLSYAVGLARSTAITVEENQRQKLYLAKPEFMFHTRIIHHTTPIKLVAKVLQGCVNVMVRPQKTYYYGYLVFQNLTAGVSAFSSDTVSSLDSGLTLLGLKMDAGEVIRQLPLELDRETLCTGESVFEECPIFIVAENCDGFTGSVVTLMLAREDYIKVVPNDPMYISVPRGKKEFLAFTSVAPLVDAIEIAIQTRGQTMEERLGLVGISRNSIIKDMALGDKIFELSAARNQTVLGYQRTEGTSLAGNYYMTIVANQDLNAKIIINAVSGIGNREWVVQSARQASGNGVFFLTPISETRQIGYFTFYLDNTNRAGKTQPHDVAIFSKYTGSVTNITIRANASAWPELESNDSSSLAATNVFRLSRGNPLYASNSYYYLLVSGVTAAAAADSSEGQQQLGHFAFVVIEERRHNDLELGRPATFDGTRLFRLRASKFDKSGDYVMRKTGNTVESMYVSVSSGNRAPFSDQHDYAFEPTDGDKEYKYPESRLNEIRIPSAELQSKNEDCAKGERDLWLTVYCRWQQCMYSLEVQFVVGNEDEKKRERKADL